METPELVTPSQALEGLTRSLRDHDVDRARIALVLGSGLGRFADSLEKARAIPYEEIEEMPRSAVPGHAGRIHDKRPLGLGVHTLVVPEELLFLGSGNRIGLKLPFEPNRLRFEPPFLHIVQPQAEIDNVDVILEFVSHTVAIVCRVADRRQILSNFKSLFVEVVQHQYRYAVLAA